MIKYSLNWYSQYKLAYRNPKDVLTNKIVPLIINSIKDKQNILSHRKKDVNNSKNKLDNNYGDFVFEFTSEQVPEIKEYNIPMFKFYINSSSELVYSNGFYTYAEFNLKDKTFNIFLRINALNNIPNLLNNISPQLSDKVRHELEHAFQVIHHPNLKQTKTRQDLFDKTQEIPSLVNNWNEYISGKPELDAHIRGAVLISKKTNTNIINILSDMIRRKLFGNDLNYIELEIENNTQNGNRFRNLYNEALDRYFNRLGILYPKYRGINYASFRYV